MDMIVARLSTELAVKPSQIVAAVTLLDEGATVPFIARYRKEATDGLDDIQLRELESRLLYLRELEERKTAVMKNIEEQGKLTESLKQLILSAETKTRVEDLYRPYKQKRRTKAHIAKEAGLAPLADSLLQDPTQDPLQLAKTFLNPEHKITDEKQALDGAKQILMEQFAEDPELVGRLRDLAWESGLLTATVAPDKAQDDSKFRDYFEYQSALAKTPSHRALAIFRGRNEGVLQVGLMIPGQDDLPNAQAIGACEKAIADQFGVHNQGRAADKWLSECVRWAWKIKVKLHLEVELIARLRKMAEEDAIQVFSTNLRDLLLASPAGPKATIGLDPGIRTGVKVAVVDATGKLVDMDTIYPHQPRKDWNGALQCLALLVKKHDVELISIGNGTASRETDKLAGDLIRALKNPKLQKIVVSESGASVYSASEFASQELPDVDVSIRGAISIARRLQDPLAELVKIDPKAIGVGQYQHDVNQTQLAKMLDSVVEDCVNAVGVDVNTASAPLLAKISGLSKTLAANIVTLRDQQGPFKNRKALLKVPRLGEKAFEQAAGFLKIADGSNPLDASSVHPEAYPVVEKILAQSQKTLQSMIGDLRFLRALKPSDYTDEVFGLPTVTDIISELEKPGRDPRPEFKTAAFKDGVEKIGDLIEGMILEGAVTNVTQFGAFIDIGVHQDGLAHISELSDSFVKDPHTVVKAGEIVKVRVLEVDESRQRIALSLCLKPKQGEAQKGQSRPKQNTQKTQRPTQTAPAQNNAMASALAKAMKR